MKTYTLKVVDIRKETKDTITICFKQPGLKKIKYKAGQYLTLIFRINGRRYIRPYSFSSCPVLDQLLEVTVKRVANGIVSNHIHDLLKVGDVVEVIEPLGEFALRDETIDKICFWGAGSGITPLYSMIKEVLHSNNSTIVYLVYGNRDFSNTIFKSSLDLLVVTFPDRLKVWHVHTSLLVSEKMPVVVTGRINSAFAELIILENSLQTAVHYICGPSGLKESVRVALASSKVPSEQVLTEDFEIVKNPDDFKDICTRLVTVRFNGDEYPLEVVKGRSVLETALDSGLELPYSCQTGSCSTCKAVLRDGELKMIGLDKRRDDLAQGEFLLCCSYPLSDNIYIEV